MRSVVFTRPAASWLILIAATSISAVTGINQGPQVGAHVIAAVLLVAVASIKMWLVGRYFMDLRDAPARLRVTFDALCAGTAGVLIGSYLVF